MSVADRVRLRRTALRISAADPALARQQAVTLIGGEPARTLRLDVTHCPAPRGWVGHPGIRSVTSLHVDRHDEGATVRIATRSPIDPGLLLAAAIRCIEPQPADVGPLVTLVPGLSADAAAVIPSMRDVLIGDEPNPHLRRCDTLVVPHPDAVPDVDRAQTVVVDRNGWTIQDTRRDVVVDPLVHRPIGRGSVADGVIGSALVADGRLVVTAPDLRIETSDDLTAHQVMQLREVRGLAVTQPLPVRWRAQLEACGVVMALDEFPQDNLDWQIESVHARRHALRWYTPTAALDQWPTVSIVLVTHRAAFLEHAVAQLAKINYPRLQVVIGLHGVEVDDRVFARLGDLHDVVLHRMSRDIVFGAAMQSTCDRADGQLVTKVDDDDYYASEHVWDLVLARMTTGATLVGKALDWIHVESENVTAFRPTYPAETFATFVAGGTLLIAKSDLAAVGGWRPVPKSVDRALIESVKRSGGLVYRTHGLGYVYVRHGGAHTATVNDQHFLTKNAQQWPGLLEHDALGTVRHG